MPYAKDYTMSVNKDRLATLLAAGVLPSRAATIVGISPGRITQLVTSDDGFKLLLDSKKAEREITDTSEKDLDIKYEEAESMLLANIINQAQGAELRDSVAALKVVAERQDRRKIKTVADPNQGTTINNYVAVMLPGHAVPAPPIDISANGEVTSIDNRSLTPLSTGRVLSLFRGNRERSDDGVDSLPQRDEPRRITPPSEDDPRESLCVDEAVLVTIPRALTNAEILMAE